MADEPITLEFLARQQQRLLDEMRSFREDFGYVRDEYGPVREELGSLRSDIEVLTAIVMRLDGTMTRVLQELRATHSQHQRLANRVRRVEERLEAPE